MAREFWLLETKFDFEWIPHYISTKENHHSDSLSRWGDPKQREKFHKLVMNTDATEVSVDENLFSFDSEI